MELKKQQFIRTINQSSGIINSLCRVYYARTEDQQDAFQDVILQLWKSFDSFRGESEINTWIYRVSLNTLLSKIRKEQRSFTAVTVEDSHLCIPEANADDQVELLNIVLQSLKPEDKAIVILFLEGYKNKEIA